MSESTDAVSALLGHAAKLVKSMSDEELKEVASGNSRLTLVRRGQRVVDVTGALNQALKAMSQLSDEQLQQVEDRHARLVLLPKGARIVFPLDVGDVASQVLKLSSEDEIVRFLDADSRLNAANLKKVAAEMSIVIPSTVRAKEALQLHIAQSVVRDRGRWSWR